ncbi:ABC transporter substrate-binding protein [Cohnella thailandensis]|uniref:Extracellular solute-binding protein n=1 Tax=Cohnella thailandensis TaxID=557557 RepID=A0A841T0K2_9BACL|nr:extracellular solute-binding protein [Cohnella thailandensis]MBB6636609.1 extracellular solute-binding protein [Cohnella thailandensis]MBP1973517.1 raffinose/stachyose/melibiose transport system substrate-binding protein [Cohnella thailandensis]
MKAKKAAFVASSLLIAGGLLTACGSDNNGGNASGTAAPTAENSASGSNNGGKKVKLTAMVGNATDTQNIAKALIAAFEKKYPNITVEIELSPGGTEGDNLAKTKLATGDMSDVFFYNSGSLLQALNPEQNLVDLTNEPFQANIEDSFKQAVTYNGKVYGAPTQSTGTGGWFYNKKIYSDLGLSVPKTWEELMANVKKISEADSGIAPIIGTYKDTWTSQLIFLSDYYNVQASAPNFAADYTANKAKYATTPSALRSFEKMQDIVGYLNKDYLATNLDAGLKMLVEGKGAHYPMLSMIIPTILQNTPDKIDDIGFFAQPGDNADQNGLTVWMPGAVYVYKNTPHLEEALQFVNFVGSVEGMEAIATVSKPTGPYVVKGAEMPEDTPQAVKDMLPYFENGKNAPALEFLSPVKGPSLENITIQVGSGQIDALKAAQDYDKDVEKQAKQLGLSGW